MTETATTMTTDGATARPGLLARLTGVIFSPRDTYAAVAARPQAFGVLALITVLMAGAQFAFLSTTLGQDLALDQQLRFLEGSGQTISDDMYAQMQQQMEYARYVNSGSLLVLVPLINATAAGLLLVVFTMLLGGSGTFRQVNAIVAHAGVIALLQQGFGIPLTYASGELSGANFGVFVPMLEADSFPVLFLGTIDLFLVWWCISLAIGIGVLYRRRTGPIAAGLIGLYGAIALVIAFIRS